MTSESSSNVIRKLLSGKEEEFMKRLLSMDRVFEALCMEITEEDMDAEGECLAARQHEEGATGLEIFYERLLKTCIGFWSVGIIKNVDDFRNVLALTLPSELSDQFKELLKEKIQEVDV